MINAYFNIADGLKVVAYMPNDEIREIARLAGIPDSDLFSFDIPAGASRPSTLKCIVKFRDIAPLYANVGPYGLGSAVFNINANGNLTPLVTMSMILMPPRPLYVQAGATTTEGVCVVEAYDVRYLWNRNQRDTVNDAQLTARRISSDGRWVTAVGTSTTPLGVLTALIGQLEHEGSSINTSAYVPYPILMNRVADYLFTPECSVAMSIDLLLSQTGFALEWDFATSVYRCVPIGYASALGQWMNAHKVAFSNGLEPLSSTAAPAESLIATWNSPSTNGQINRMPSKFSLSYPWRTVEGRTYYDNFPNARILSKMQSFSVVNEVGYVNYISGTKTRSPYGTLVLKEPRPLAANDPTAWDPLNPTFATVNTGPVSWEWYISADVSYTEAVTELLVTRCSMTIGKVVWGGWPTDFPMGMFRGTHCTFTIGYRSGEWLPITITEANDDDWIFGPNGKSETDPRDIILSKGTTHARRLGSGVMQIDSAPPMCRVFPARITSSYRIGLPTSGNSYWAWVYTFEEVEPNNLAYYPLTTTVSTQLGRSSSAARNLMEAGNIFVANLGNVANVIAAGVRQVDYPAATIDALPISNLSIVMMCEQFPTAYTESGSPPFGQEYWFSTPNAVQVVCT